MGPKKQLTDLEKRQILDKMCEGINTKNGNRLVIGRIGKYPEIAEHLRIKFVPSYCQQFTDASGGGYPKGRIIIICGNEGSGFVASRLL